MQELVILLEGYQYKLDEVERELGRELLKVGTQINPVYEYTVIDGQRIAFLQGEKKVLELIVRELKESINILTQKG